MSDYSFSFSGSDCHTFVSFMSPSLYGVGSAATKVKLDCINTISISVHEQRTPVRRLGYSGVVGFAGSIRTVAGSIIMTIVKDNPFDELITKSGIRNNWTARVISSDSGNETYKDIKHPYNHRGAMNSFEYRRTNNSPDSKFSIQNLTTLPAMKFRMEFVSEYYRATKQPYSSSVSKSEDRPLLRVMELHNVFIISENVVTSVNNMVTELVLQYVASDYVEFGEELTLEKIQALKNSQIAPPSVAKKSEANDSSSTPVVAAKAEEVITVNPSTGETKKTDEIKVTPTVTASPATTTSSTATTNSKTIPSTTPEIAPTVPKSDTSTAIKTGSTTVNAKKTDNVNNKKVAIFDKDIIGKIKSNKYNADEEIAKNLKGKDLELPISELLKAESAFDYNSFKSNNFPDKLASNNLDPNKQPDLSKEAPLFAIAALSEKAGFYGFREYTSNAAYANNSEAQKFSTSLNNVNGNDPTNETKIRAAFFEKFKEKIKNQDIGYNEYKTFFEETKKDLSLSSYPGWDEEKNKEKYSSIDNLMINYNSRILFNSSRTLDDQREFLKQVEKQKLIPDSSKEIYLENFKAIMYDQINLSYNYNKDDPNKKQTIGQDLDKAKNTYYYFLSQTQNLNVKQKEELIKKLDLQIKEIETELFKEKK